MAFELTLMEMLEVMRNSRMDSSRLGDSCNLITNFGSSPVHRLVMTLDLKELKKYLSAHPSELDVPDSESGVTPLITACYIGDLRSVKLLVGRGAQINFKCSGLNGYGLHYSNITPVYVAAEEGYDDVVEFLAEKGADLTQRCSPIGFTPLHTAVCSGHVDVVSILVRNYHVEVNVQNNDGDDPILSAVNGREHLILEVLLSADGVNPNVPDAIERMTPLHLAAYSGDFASVELLLLYGADVNAELLGGFTPLDVAAQERKQQVCSMLAMAGARRNNRRQQWHPYSTCVLIGLSKLKMAINRGVNVNSPVYKGATALHHAVLKGAIDVCKFLIRKGADIQHKDAFGNSPLHKAAGLGHIQVAELLFEKGADVNVKNQVSSTPLHYAAKQGCYSMVRWLISKGADLNIYEHKGGSPIFSAAAAGYSNVVELLLNSGVDPNSKAHVDSIENISILLVACMRASNKPKMIKALVNAGANVNEHLTYEGVAHPSQLTPLHLIPISHPNFVDSLRILIEAGAFIDYQLEVCYSERKGGGFKSIPSNSCFPLDFVLASKNLEAIQLLSSTLELFKAVRKNNLKLANDCFARGGIVNCCSVKFETPLIYASWKGYLHMVKFLLSKGAAANSERVKKSTPLHYAVKYNHKVIVIELLKAGSKYDARCCNKTPLELAEEANHREIAALLKFMGRWFLSSGKTNICPGNDTRSDLSFVKLLEEVDDEILENDLQHLFGRV